MVDNTPRHIGTLSPEMALLGLLYDGPGHGYDLHRKVVTDLGQVWHLSQSQAYAILKRLEAREDISVEEIPQEKLPPRQLLKMTSLGRKRFLEWLDTPSGGSTRAIRMEFVTRLYFLEKFFPEKLIRAFDMQKAEAKAHIHRLEKTLVELPEEQIYNCMSLDLRLNQLRIVLDWLDECQKNFQYDKTTLKEIP
jgi:DNA-binding PadR family transcriptional regulator